jgi:peptidyl-prolyl cis-trans isomerase D
MATLQSIRNHGKLLLVILGIALLAFILGDFLTSGSSFFNKNSQTVAEIADEDIHINDYLAAVDQLTEVYKVETQRDPDDETRFALREDAWQTLVMDKTLSLQAEEIGMSVTADELTNLCLGATPHPALTQSR